MLERGNGSIATALRSVRWDHRVRTFLERCPRNAIRRLRSAAFAHGKRGVRFSPADQHPQ